MIDFIDLSEWNEYIADDVWPGPIPCGVVIDTMQKMHRTSMRDMNRLINRFASFFSSFLLILSSKIYGIFL